MVIRTVRLSDLNALFSTRSAVPPNLLGVIPTLDTLDGDGEGEATEEEDDEEEEEEEAEGSTAEGEVVLDDDKCNVGLMGDRASLNRAEVGVVVLLLDELDPLLLVSTYNPFPAAIRLFGTMLGDSCLDPPATGSMVAMDSLAIFSRVVVVDSSMEVSIIMREDVPSLDDIELPLALVNVTTCFGPSPLL